MTQSDRNYNYCWFAFLFQTNPSPSEETNHTDSLSTSYDTSADPQSLNATTPGQGVLHDDHSGLHVRNNHIQKYVLQLFVTLSKMYPLCLLRGGCALMTRTLRPRTMTCH